MKKYIFILTLILFVFSVNILISIESYASPALSRWVNVTQRDGSQVSIILKGDEYYHYYSTKDDIPVFKKENSYYYGYLKNDKIIISDLLAHDKENRTLEEIGFLYNNKNLINDIKEFRQSSIYRENHRRMERMSKNKKKGNTSSYIGSKKGIVILVNFADLSFTTESANADFTKMFNQPNYSKDGCIGSVRDYFLDQSYGKFNLSFDVIGPVTLSHNYSYYGTNSIENGSDKRPYEMVIEACNLIDDEVNFTDYDWDKDGEVDQVFIIYAGYGEHAGAPSNTIWPHESHLSSRMITLDGVNINTYACSCELRDNRGAIYTGIGTPCHEFSHCLGFPDLYDTDYSGAFGMSYWDVMNSGSHSGPTGNGEVPYGYSAYERWIAGWLEPTEITETTLNLELKDVGFYPEAYIIYNPGNINEFYLIENHQSDRWFQYVNTYQDMHGLMITHVDYDELAWNNNSVNPNSKHQRMSIIPADNSYGYTEEDLGGDLFPGTKNITLLTHTSHTNCGGKLFNKNTDGSFNQYMAIGSIEENGNGNISFNIVDVKNFPKPKTKEATDITDIGYTANWEEILDAEYYILEHTSSYLWHSVLPITKTEQITVNHDTSIHLNWLQDEGESKYRIKGVIDGIPTEWSEYQNVDRSNSVNELEFDIDCPILYYGTDGLERKCPLPGLNIIVKGNKAQKVYVKNK